MTSNDPGRSSRDPNTLKARYLENSWRCHLATSAVKEYGRLSYLATAWLLVEIDA